MRLPRELFRIAILLFLAAGPAVAQIGGSRGNGGHYGGPGDTVPPGGNGRGGGGGGNTGGPPNIPPGGGAPPRGGYAPGSNPLAPPPFLPGGPGDPTNQPPDQPMAPGSRPRTDSPTSWQLWWHYNRWAHLRNSSQVQFATTGSTGFYLGRGQTTPVQPMQHADPSELRQVVRPALVQALRGDPSIDLASAGAIALAKLRDVPGRNEKESFDALIGPLLGSGSQAISEKALLALGVRGDPLAFSDLASVLLDEPSGRTLLQRQRIGVRHRFFAAAAIGLLAQRVQDDGLRARAYAVLTRVLRDEDTRPELAAGVLLALGLVPLPVEVGILGDGTFSETPTRVDEILTVLAYLEHPKSPTLARTQAPRTLALLLEGAPEPLRQRALLSLLAAVDQTSKEPREVLGAAVQALGQVATSGSEPLDAAARKELERIAFKSGEDRLARAYGVLALARVAARPGPGDEPMAGLEPTRKLLLQRVDRARGEMLGWTALALGLLEEHAVRRGDEVDPDVSAKLRELLRDEQSEEVAGAACIALGLIGDVDAEPMLVEALQKSAHERVRGYAALALGLVGQPSSLPELRTFVERSSQQPFALEQGAIALALLRDQQVSQDLVALLTEGASTAVQASIASAMGWIRDPRSLLPLAMRVDDASLPDSARGWSAVALGRIADVDEWPGLTRLAVDVQYDVAIPELTDPEFQEGLLDVP